MAENTFFTNPTPRQLVARWLIIIGAAIGLLLFVFYLGTSKARQWADSEYLQKSAERDAKIAALELSAEKHRGNADKLAAENAFLKKQNEAQAEVLTAQDAQLKGDASKLGKLLDARNKRNEEIDLTTDFDAQLCGMCADFARSGFPLSDQTCGRCRK